MADNSFTQTLSVLRIPYIVLVIFTNIIGQFGNWSVIFALNQGHLKSRYGIQLLILVVSHIICLFFGLVDVYFILAPWKIIRRTCMYSMLPSIFFINLQSCMYLVMGSDLYIAIIHPVLYRRASRLNVYLIIPSVLMSIFVCAIGLATVNDNELPSCSPIIVLTGIAYKFYTYWTLFVILTILLLYIILLLIFRYRTAKPTNPDGPSSNTPQMRLYRNLRVMMVVFLFTWFYTSLTPRISDALGLNDWDANVMEGYMIIFGMFGFCQTYFVLFSRSKEFATIFKRQLKRICCCIKLKIRSESVTVAQKIGDNVLTTVSI